MTIIDPELEKAQAAWHARLLLNALPHANNLHEALIATEVALTMQPMPAVSAKFSHDIWNRRAQAVLNKAMKAGSKLAESAKKDLEKALKKSKSMPEMASALIDVLQRYRVQLAQVLSATEMAALLQGAREVVKQLPSAPPAGAAVVPPPTLPLEQAAEIMEGMRDMSDAQREQLITLLPPEQQEYIAEVVKSGTLNVKPPPPLEVELDDDEPGKVQYATIEEAVAELGSKNLMTRPLYDALDDAARAKAFTVAGVEAQETLGKIRDALVENIEEGVDLETFRKKVMERVDEGTFLSDAHLETVFRVNVQSAFSDGQMGVLSHPFIRSGFPYASYYAIHDDRVRHNHLALETYGIQGTNIYRVDDPVFKMFRPPWDWQDRCSWFPMSIRQAAQAGIEEAIEWLRTGIEPDPPAWVKMPPFSPPEAFRRSLDAMSLSMEGIGFLFGMVGDKWHGPTPPGPGWVEVGKGPRGGKIWTPKYRADAAAKVGPGHTAKEQPPVPEEPKTVKDQPAQSADAQTNPEQTKALTFGPKELEPVKNYIENDPARESLRTSEVTQMKPTQKKGANSSFFVTMADGQKGIFKPESGETHTFLDERANVIKPVRQEIKGRYFAREAAASDIASALGLGDLVPLTVIRTVKDKMGSAQQFVDNAVAAEEAPIDVQIYDGPEDLGRAAAFDYLTGNADRHQGNWMIASGGKLVLIDNGLSFPDTKFARWGDSMLLERTYGHPTNIPPQVKTWKWESIQPFLEFRGLNELEIKFTKERFDDLQRATTFGELAN